MIGAAAVVVKDVPPYAIVVGNPARVAKLRFGREIVDELLELAWWDLDEDDVEVLLPRLLASDARAFITSLRAMRCTKL